MRRLAWFILLILLLVGIFYYQTHLEEEVLEKGSGKVDVPFHGEYDWVFASGLGIAFLLLVLLLIMWIKKLKRH